MLRLFFLKTVLQIAYFLLHPKLNFTAEKKKNGPCHEMGGQKIFVSIVEAIFDPTCCRTDVSYLAG
jgi:hypothetical protein